MAEPSTPGTKMSFHAAWAMAVGGMIGGGIYTLAGVLLGLAGPLAGLSLLLGGLIAVATARSYLLLTVETRQEGAPIPLLIRKGRRTLASLVAWWLLIVYVLAMTVYSFTLGRYVGLALNIPPGVVALVVAVVVAALVAVNLRGIREPSRVQIWAVWIELLVLLGLAGIGFARWNPENLTANVPAPSLFGVLAGMSATFIAFEGFEMLAYDVRELRYPHKILSKALPAAIIAVALAYALVTVGAASLVGASVLVEQKEHALAVAGKAAGGSVGLGIVTIAACASAVSAINASLFSVGRLTRSAAQSGLLPSMFARLNARGCPHYAIVGLGLATAGLASFASLDALVQTASLGFLALFTFVNVAAFLESKPRSVVSLLGALGAGTGTVIVAGLLAKDSPRALVAFVGAAALGLVAHLIQRSRGVPPAEDHRPPPPLSARQLFRDYTPPPGSA